MPADDPDERAQERVGSVLNDKWTLERLVGIGGMAAVYAGLHRNGARAAIKILHPALARRAEVRERFLREGYAANRVSHSGVVKVLDDDVIEEGPDAGGAFLVMELLEGQSLEDRLERGPIIAERELLPIVRAVLDVLEVAHKAGVIHRDLKPENLFLARDPEKPTAPPRLKILDFGLARIQEGGNRTMAGIAIGTPSYMPPEQAAGRVFDVDARSDLFAVGASCFRILANRTVHPAEGALAICARMAKEPAPKLRTVAPNVSEPTAAAIDRALEFRRDARWPDAAAMRDAIDRAIASLGGDVVEIDSGMIEVEAPTEIASESVARSARQSPRPAPESAPERSRPRESPPPAPLPTQGGGSRFLLWVVIVALTAVAAKLAYDHFATRPLAIADAAGATSASNTATASAIEVAEAAPPVDATVLATDLDATLDGAGSFDAESDGEGDGASLDVAQSGDAEVEAGHTVTTSTADAGTHTHRDAGSHHTIHHGTHRR